MASINAKRVAHAVMKKARKGELIVMKDILRDTGYSESISKQPTKVTRTRTYIEATRPLISGIASEIERIKQAMASKDLKNEEYKTLVSSLDVLTKNHQLLSGGVTERRAFVIPSEVIERNVIDVESKDVSAEPLNKGRIDEAESHK